MPEASKHERRVGDQGIWFDLITDNVILSVHTWLVRTPHHSIPIDTGCGTTNPGHPYPSWITFTNLLERLLAAGLEPAGIDYVLLTHLHADHVGWNTQLMGEQWIPTFPQA